MLYICSIDIDIEKICPFSNINIKTLKDKSKYNTKWQQLIMRFKTLLSYNIKDEFAYIRCYIDRQTDDGSLGYTIKNKCYRCCIELQKYEIEKKFKNEIILRKYNEFCIELNFNDDDKNRKLLNNSMLIVKRVYKLESK